MHHEQILMSHLAVIFGSSFRFMVLRKFKFISSFNFPSPSKKNHSITIS